MDDQSLPPMRRALAFHTAVDQSVIQSDNAAMGKWQRRFNPVTSSIAYHTSDEIHRRSSRLRTARLECVDACVLLDRIKDLDSCTIYADPPYPSANTTGYAVRGFDRAGLADVRMAQRGGGRNIRLWRQVGSAGLALGYTAGLAPANQGRGGGKAGGFMAKGQGGGNAAGVVR